MRASFYEGAGRFRTGSAAVPTPAAGEALLKVRRVGICGTDLHIFQGHLDHRVPKGGIIGHETFAEVAEAPPGGGFAKGDRVVVEPLRVCNACRACRMGATWLCYKLKVLGVEMPGGLQEDWAGPARGLAPGASPTAPRGGGGGAPWLCNKLRVGGGETPGGRRDCGGVRAGCIPRGISTPSTL